MTKYTLPSKQEILDYLSETGGLLRKKDCAKAFKVPNDCRAVFRKFLQTMERDEEIRPNTSTTRRKKKIAPDISVHDSISEVGIFIATCLDENGELLCESEIWLGDNKPTIYVEGNIAPKIGDKFLARTTKQQDGLYTVKVIRIISQNADKVIGVLDNVKGGFSLLSADKKDRDLYFISSEDAPDCQSGDVVIVNPTRGKTSLMKNATLSERVGAINDAKSYSLLSIVKYAIPNVFSEKVLAETDNMTVPALNKRTDLRDIPLITIDGADARDFDDAVYAEKTESGFRLLVAIADVCHYVKNDSTLEKEAIKRGNSVYFPDRVVPMLPEKLSNGLCSLVPNEERACIAVWMDIDNNGELVGYKFIRGLMKSHARLTYEQAQSAQDGNICETTKPIIEQINHLYSAFELLIKARHNRGTLELDLPENQVFMNKDGQVDKILPRIRLDSHKMIEEFMISANVASAVALEDKKAKAIMYRVHDVPPLDKLENLQASLRELNLSLPKDGAIKPMHFTRLLNQSKDNDYSHLISDLVLRSLSQAVYSPDNLGHFGLALLHYCHFTSPIRRYSDVLIHRALIDAYKLGDDGLSKLQSDNFEDIGEAISNTERRSQRAERETMDRYLAHFLKNKVGATFVARISGVSNFAMFITLQETGADGVIFLKNLGNDFFVHDEITHAAVGQRTGLTYRIGESVVVELISASPVKGGLEFTIVDGGTIDKNAKINSHKRPNKGNNNFKKNANRSTKKNSYKKRR